MKPIEYRLPIGIQTFEEIREGGYLYADKTAYVYKMTHRFKFVFLSRPRRFGKSLLCSTLKSYFEGRSDLFRGLAIDQMETEWQQHPVLLISMASIKAGTEKEFNDKVNLQLSRYENEYGLPKVGETPGARLQNLIEQASVKTGQKTVVIIDEYDAPLLSVMHHPEKLKEMRILVRSLYGCLKDCDNYLHFVFITGISKFSQLSIFSELNNLKLITMMPEYSAVCGITEDELHQQWGEAVADMAERMNTGIDETYQRLKERYDGYHFASDMTDVYNPFSLLNAIDEANLHDHWFETGTPTVLIEMLQKFRTDITRLDGSKAYPQDFDAPTEQLRSVLPLFYQSGYLTIKDYDPQLGIYTLGYPNNEVRTGVMRALIPNYVCYDTITTGITIADLYRSLLDNDLNTALHLLRDFFATIPYAEGAANEGHFQQMLYVVFSLMGMYLQTEVRTARGRIDVVWKSPTDIYVFELKIDRPAREAIDQIDRMDYLIPFTRDNRRLHKVGISFSTKARTIEEYIIE